uniref:Uncharacterized protein n=1 Tax=Ixodes ricinus TaxID=34613 RepID=V5H8M7_IXORI
MRRLGTGRGGVSPLLLRRFIPELAYLTSLLVPTTVRLPLFFKGSQGSDSSAVHKGPQTCTSDAESRGAARCWPTAASF